MSDSFVVAANFVRKTPILLRLEFKAFCCQDQMGTAAMTLNIETLDELIIDRTGGNEADSDDSDAASTVVTYLLRLPAGDAGIMSQPDVAIQKDFAKTTAGANETIKAVRLAQSDGTAFFTTQGVGSGSNDVNGNSIYLFLDPDSEYVVLGVVGNIAPTMDRVTGDVAYPNNRGKTTASKAIHQDGPLLRGWINQRPLSSQFT